jgi:hypothetical protein
LKVFQHWRLICRSGYWFMIWKKPSEQLTGKTGVPSLTKF